MQPVKAVDNLPPAAVEGAAGSFDGANVSLEWQASSDDGVVVGFMSYPRLLDSDRRVWIATKCGVARVLRRDGTL